MKIKEILQNGKWWFIGNAKSIRAITWGLYQYFFGWGKDIRKRHPRTKARWLFAHPLWIGRDWFAAPRFEAAVLDGMGEHYGYPRHYARIILTWNHNGYAFGVEFSKNAASQSS